MSAPSKTRKRAVRLTADALRDLQAALAERWQGDARSGRLTHEARAEFMGVSVATAKKILAGEGVDRATLALAFRSLGLAWDDALCERVPEEPLPEEPPAEPVPIAVTVAVAPPPAPVRRLRRPHFAFGAALLLFAVLAGMRLAPSAPTPAPPPDRWRVAFDRLVYDATQHYYDSHYAQARREALAALELARKKNAGREMAGPFHLLGQLDEKWGDWPGARANYVSALKIRDVYHDEASLPTLHEAIGLVETRMGEYADAERSLTLCLEGHRAARNPEGVALAYRGLGSLALAWRDFDGADRLFRKSLDGLKGLGKPDTVADVQERCAMVLLARGRAAEAREGFRRALAYWQRRGHADWVAGCEMHLALAEARLDEFASAKARLARAKAGYERLGDARGIAEVAGHLARLSG